MKIHPPSLAEAARLASFGLVVLIWIVQVILYPAFAAIPADRFRAWHAGYTRAITWIVGPLMLAQAATVGLLIARERRLSAILAGLLVASAWAATGLVAVPLHEKLQAAGHDPEVITRLVRTNWMRTAAWTLAFVLLLL